MAKLLLNPTGFKTWEVAKDFNVSINNFKVKVPKGFRTDLASIPRIFWNIFPPFGRYTQAAVVHDYLYRIQHNRKQADKIFYDLMIEYGTRKWKAKIMYLAVRIFGYYAWK